MDRFRVPGVTPQPLRGRFPRSPNSLQFSGKNLDVNDIMVHFSTKAIGILKVLGELKGKIPEGPVFIGATSLYGKIEKVEGMFPALMAAKSVGFKKTNDKLIE